MSSTSTVAVLARIAADHAFRSPVGTAISGMTIWCGSQPTDPTPAMFTPKFYMVVQGAKRLTIGGETHLFGRGSYGIASVGLPLASQVIEASRERPYLAIELALDAGVVAGLLFDMRDAGPRDGPAFAAAHAGEDVAGPVDRLVQLLGRPDDIPVLTRQFERELYYRLLQGPVGDTLRQVVQTNTRLAQIRTAVTWICENADKAMRVEELAGLVGMSVTSFHRHFKAVTAYSPLAFQRHLRLIEAQRLLASGTTNVTRAAFATGYASSSQFSREYKSMFGVPPIRAALQRQKPAAG